MRAKYVDAGHILGSASVVIEATENRAVRRLIFPAMSAGPGCRSFAIPSRPRNRRTSSSWNRPMAIAITKASPRAGALARVVRETPNAETRATRPRRGRAQGARVRVARARARGEDPAIPIVIDSPLAHGGDRRLEINVELFARTEAPSAISSSSSVRFLLPSPTTLNESKA